MHGIYQYVQFDHCDEDDGYIGTEKATRGTNEVVVAYTDICVAVTVMTKQNNNVEGDDQPVRVPWLQTKYSRVSRYGDGCNYYNRNTNTVDDQDHVRPFYYHLHMTSWYCPQNM